MIYDDLAEQLELLCSDDALVAEAHCIVTRTGLKTCRVSEIRDDIRHDVDASGEHSGIIHVLMALCKRSSYPVGIGWCALEVAYDMAAGRMRVCMHYGFDDPLDDRRLYTRDLMVEPVAPLEIARFMRRSFRI